MWIYGINKMNVIKIQEAFMWIRNILIGLLVLIVIALAVLLAMIGIANSGVGAEKLTEDDLNPTWMASLDDNTKINEMYIPGTHDSGALYSFFGISGKCQSYGIKDQLNMGVRFLDIRLQLRDDKLAVVHSFVDQKLTFESVLEDIKTFMQENPSEYIIVSIKEDADPENSTLKFASVVENYLRTYLPEDMLNTDSAVPETLGNARGKVSILSRYSGATIGIPAYNGWQDSTWFELGSLYVQDYYKISETDAKMASINVAYSRAHVPSSYALVINFTSCYLEKGFPPTNAPVTAKIINPLVLDQLREGKAAPCVFVSDFVTPEFINAIIDQNLK
jgi:1-phosphatidylinositol phosphodiesterase